MEIYKLVPISVFAAVTLFFVKEILEYRRKQKTKKSKKRALYSVIYRELNKNQNSIDDFFKILNFMEKNSKNPSFEFKLITLKHGYESCVLQCGEKSLQMGLPFFTTKSYEMHILDLHELDEDFAVKIDEVYNDIYFLSDKRNMLAALMRGELEGFLRYCAISLPAMLGQNEDFYLDKIEKLNEFILKFNSKDKS